MKLRSIPAKMASICSMALPVAVDESSPSAMLSTNTPFSVRSAIREAT